MDEQNKTAAENAEATQKPEAAPGADAAAADDKGDNYMKKKFKGMRLLQYVNDWRK